MSLTLIGSYNYVAFGVSVPFTATGGASPYTYSMAPNGIGGSINSSGLYTAPFVSGTDIIKVTDSQGRMILFKVKVGSVLHLLCDIIQKRLGLDEGRVYIYNQKLLMPTDEGLFVAISPLSVKPFATSNRFDPETDQEIITGNFHSTIQIDILSRGTEALVRKEEVILALKSQYAQQQQELNSFLIGKLPTGFTSLSGVDGAAIPYRFSITLGIQYSVTNTGVAAYFDTFEEPEVITNV